MKVAYIGGLWSRNIGNAFYNLGTEAFLKKVGIEEVYFVPDPPQWDCMEINGNYDLIGSLDVDLVLLTGPCLNLKLREIYEKTFTKLHNNNIPFAFLSAGMSLYDKGEAKEGAELLRKYSPEFIFTRDDFSANLLREENIPNIFSGICMSMYLNEAVKLPKLTEEKYLVLNFDETEPVLIGNAEKGFLSQKRNWFKRNNLPAAIDGVQVVRTRNDSSNLPFQNIYSRPNSYHSDLPYGYLALLQNAEYVLTERVHTCAATLILGGKCQYIPNSNRSLEKRTSLLEKVMEEPFMEKPSVISKSKLNAEKEKVENKFKSVIKGI